MPVERQPAFQSERVARAQSTGHNTEFLACYQNFMPDAFTGRFIGGNVNLEAVLRGVAGARNQDVAQSADRPVRKPVKLDLGQVRVSQLLQRIHAPRALDGDLREVVT